MKTFDTDCFVRFVNTRVELSGLRPEGGREREVNSFKCTLQRFQLSLLRSLPRPPHLKRTAVCEMLPHCPPMVSRLS